MAEKAATKEKKTAKKKINNGDSLVCDVCGMSVIVEEVGGIPVAEETDIALLRKADENQSHQNQIDREKIRFSWFYSEYL